MKIWYQSYVDYENGAAYWDALKAHLDDIVDEGTEVHIKGITPFDSYAHPVVEWRCAPDVPGFEQQRRQAFSPLALLLYMASFRARTWQCWDLRSALEGCEVAPLLPRT